MTTADAFLEDLRGYIHAQDEKPLLGVSFYEGVIGGKLSREQLKHWALNMFYVSGQHIRAFGGIFLNTGLSPLDCRVRQHIVENLIDEETNQGRGDEPHWKLAARLARALGATDVELMNPYVAKESVEYVEWVIDLGRREYGIVTLAAMSIGGETRTDKGIGQMLQALRDHYGLSREALEFFYAHIGEAEAHGDPVFDMVREWATTQERQKRIRKEVQTWCKKFAASADGVLRVAMGVEPGVQVHLGPTV